MKSWERVYREIARIQEDLEQKEPDAKGDAPTQALIFIPQVNGRLTYIPKEPYE